METRVYDGHLVVDGQESELLRLKVLLSIDNGIASGTGSFEVPWALVGVDEGASIRYRTDRGETITLLLSEIDPAEGRAYFLTLGALPAGAAMHRRTG